VTRKLVTSAALLVASAGFLCFWPSGTNWAPRFATSRHGLEAITVPAGFRIELASAPGVVSYPMLGDFDDRGRLFLCESSGRTMKTPEMTADPNYQVTVLEDTNGDGVFDKSTVFADKLTLPAGAVWLDGSLYVAAPPDLLRLTDTDGDDRADKREIVVTGWNLSANAASLHGPILGPDGWLYLTDGRHGYKIRTPEGKLLEGKASRIWRVRPDGTGLEAVAGGGFDNPVEVVFTPAGEIIGTMTYFTDPKAGERDALLHFVEGGVYPKWHPVVDEFVQTGGLMPVMTKFARTAPSGLLRYSGGSFGPQWHGALFSAHFNTHRVLCHRLERDGASFRTTDSEFLVSTDPDFHPTDVIQAPDGSLIVVDTGAWFIHGCPLSRQAKPDIRGGIYRVRPLKPPPKPPSDPVEQACRKVFDHFRSGAPEDAEAIRAALSDPSVEVRVAAARSAGMLGDRLAVDQLMSLVQSAEPPVRRQAATALGQIGDRRAAASLLSAAATAQDRFVEHAIIYALIQLGDVSALSRALGHDSPRVRKAALIALDQLPAKPLRSSQLIPFLSADDAALRQAALWVVSRRPEWAGSAAIALRASLRLPALAPGEEQALGDALAGLCGQAAIQNLIGEFVADPALEPSRRRFLLSAMERCGSIPYPPSWIEGFRRSLASGDAAVQIRALGLIRTRALEALDREVLSLAADPRMPADVRVTAISALAARLNPLPEALFTFLLDTLNQDPDAALRLSVAQLLARLSLSDRQLATLARSLDQPDPLLLASLSDAFRHSQSSEARAAAAPLLARVEEQRRSRRENLTRLEPVLRMRGDAARGREIFFGAKAACSSCHTIGSEGGQVGPDLTAIGAIRSPHDLLEAIVLPSASFVPGHESYRVETNRDVYTGILRERSHDAIVLMTGPAEEVWIPRAGIQKMETSTVSLMPDGYGEILNHGELADLLAYLRAQVSR
jgi:putative membrane-bound dehydrogenase-like protein